MCGAEAVTPALAQVLNHDWIKLDVSQQQQQQDDEATAEQIKMVNRILFDFLAPKESMQLQKMDHAQNYLDVITDDRLDVLIKALDVLVMIRLLEYSAHAHAFLKCGFAKKLAVLTNKYHYRKK
jgi:hypothetical protein